MSASFKPHCTKRGGDRNRQPPFDGSRQGATTFSTMGLFATPGINDTQHNGECRVHFLKVMLSIVALSGEPLNI
jgi:hypothetical protein